MPILYLPTCLAYCNKVSIIHVLISWYFFQLKIELEAFDPSFFEEIEDLKYNYKRSVERNVLYERQLRHLSKQFGVTIQIEDDDHFWLIMFEYVTSLEIFRYIKCKAWI